MKKPEFTPETIKKLAGNKKTYIYAANLEGIGYCKLFSRMGLNVEGFIDSRKYDGGRKRGKPVVHPDDFFASRDTGEHFVLIATKHRKYKKIATEQCANFGLVENKSFIHAMELCEYLPTIEVIGACNLRCCSCHMGLSETRQGGKMKPETYRQVLAKMTKEIPFMNSVYLFLWGEPLLHPDLPEIIRITNEFGIACDISTNLNYGRYLEEIIKAGPDLLSIPCSGTGENYETTHTGGNWKAFKENLYRLREYIDRHKTDTSVRIFYHMYKHNLNEDYDRIESIAGELGYYFFPIIANIFPEKVLDYKRYNKPLPPEMQKAGKMLLFDIDDQLEYAYQQKHLFCPFMKAFPTVRWDLSVVHCSNMTNTILDDNYLNVSFEQLCELRDKHPQCGICMKEGVHRFFDVAKVTVEKVDGKRVVRRQF